MGLITPIVCLSCYPLTRSEPPLPFARSSEFGLNSFAVDPLFTRWQSSCLSTEVDGCWSLPHRVFHTYYTEIEFTLRSG